MGYVSFTKSISPGNLSHFSLDPRDWQPRSGLLGLLRDRASSHSLLSGIEWVCSGAEGKGDLFLL